LHLINSNNYKMKTKFNGILTLLLALTVQFVFAQKTVSGTVSDDGGPLPGVSVLVKGTTTGVETDFDGKYAIQAKQGDVLQFSYVGKQTVEKTVGTANTIDVTLVDDASNVLDEVTIVGFGRKVEPKTATYAVQKLDGEDLNKAKETNIANALSGKIAGVQVTASSGSVGSSSRVQLRGVSSLTGNNQPLYVIDGVPVDNANIGNSSDGGGVDVPTGVADISPDDIESISVLKGPAASALYGVRASNGVIVIKTKSGKKSGEKLGISLNSSITFENPLLLPSFQNSYGQGPNNDYFYWVDGQNDDGGVDESWGPPLDVGLEFTQWNSYTVGGAPLPWVSQPDNIKDFFDTGYTINNNLSFSGASENGDMNYRLSVGNSDQKGMVPFTEFGKITTAANASKTFGKKLTAQMSVNYTNSYSDNLPVVGYDNENPIQQMYWSGRNVDFNALRDWRNLPLAPVGTAAEGTPINWNNVYQNNPFWLLETNTNTYAKDKVIGTVSLNYAFNDHLSLNGKVGTDYSSTLQTSRQAHGSNSAPDGSYSEYVRSFTETNADFLLAYNRDLTEKISFEMSLGGNRMHRFTKRNFALAPALELPGLFNLSNIKSGSSYSLTNDKFEQAINSFYGYGKIGYNDYLFVEFSGRNDWMSVLPMENNSFFYPSVTMSAVLSDMFGMKENKVLDYLKIRGGWSKVGGAGALGEYSLKPVFGLPATGFGDISYAFLPGTLNNPNIKPETTTGIEAGLDVKMFDNALRFNITYYDQTSSDLVMPVQISSATGYTAAFQNVGEMRNKGIEVELNSTVYKSKGGFDVDFGVNFAKNNNEVVSIGGLESLVLGGQWSMTLEARPGMPYGSIVGSYFERDDAGNIIHDNGLPVIASGTKVLGNVQADWTGGATLGFSYKGIKLSALVDAKMGGDVYSMSTTWGRYAGVLEETLLGREGGIVGAGVMSDGSGGYVANNVVQTAENYNKAAYSNSIVESSVFDASYVKLRQVMLSYELPKKWLNNTKIDGVDISFIARNLAILYKTVPHIDPETAFSDRNSDLGQEFGQQPSARSMGVNINIKL
jgi:TonB-linked SusC/RagA family outer membrane protein